jgi:hypothetical protein
VELLSPKLQISRHSSPKPKKHSYLPYDIVDYNARQAPKPNVSALILATHFHQNYEQTKNTVENLNNTKPEKLMTKTKIETQNKSKLLLRILFGVR